MRGISLGVAAMVAACSSPTPDSTKTPEVADTAPEQAIVTEETEVAVVAEALPEEPTDEFYDACVVARFPGSGALVAVTPVRVGDFVAQLAGDSNEFGWVPAGDQRFAFRVNKLNHLTAETGSASALLRQVNAPPRELDACGPRSVLVEGLAINRREMPPPMLYAATQRGAAIAAKAALSAPPRPYVEPASTDEDGPYTGNYILEKAETRFYIWRDRPALPS